MQNKPSRRLEVCSTLARKAVNLLLSRNSRCLFYLTNYKISISKMSPFGKSLAHVLASFTTAVFAISSETINLTDTNNSTLPTVNFPTYNISKNVEPTVYCHTNRPLPDPQMWGQVDLVECGLLIIALLADETADLQTVQWTSTFPYLLPWTLGVSPNCKVRISANDPGSTDIFQPVMIVQRVALVVTRCVGNSGGFVKLGPREQFLVDVFGLELPSTA
ncbi:hypothetical protein BDR22DRAFT_719111 [Usnea florida]